MFKSAESASQSASLCSLCLLVDSVSVTVLLCFYTLNTHIQHNHPLTTSILFFFLPSSDHTTPSWTSPSPLPPSLGSFSLSTPFQHSTVHTLAHHDAHTNTSSSSFNFQTLFNSYSSPCFHFTVNTTTPPTRYLHTHTLFYKHTPGHILCTNPAAFTPIYAPIHAKRTHIHAIESLHAHCIAHLTTKRNHTTL